MPEAEKRATQLTRTDTAVKAALNLVPWVGGSLAVLYEEFWPGGDDVSTPSQTPRSGPSRERRRPYWRHESGLADR